jgi:hypothetical protein
MKCSKQLLVTMLWEEHGLFKCGKTFLEDSKCSGHPSMGCTNEICRKFTNSSRKTNKIPF